MVHPPTAEEHDDSDERGDEEGGDGDENEDEGREEGEEGEGVYLSSNHSNHPVQWVNEN